MKKKSLIVSGVAALGVIAAVGTSFSIYLVEDSKTISIGGITANVDVNYGISDITADEEVNPLTPANRDLNYSFDVYGVKGESSEFAQPYVKAKIAVEIIPNNALLTADSSLTAALKVNYTADTTFASKADLNSITKWTRDDSTGKLSGSLTTYIHVNDTNGTNLKSAVDLTLNLNESITEETYVTTYAEIGYSVNITVSNDPTYQVPYLVGDMNDWSFSSKYEMVANIEATGTADSQIEWMWLGNLAEGTQVKAHHENGTWSADKDGGGNTTAPANMTGAYWTGSGSDAISFSTGQ